MGTAVIISRKKNLMENDFNRAYLIDIPFGVNLKTLLWILVISVGKIFPFGSLIPLKYSS